MTSIRVRERGERPKSFKSGGPAAASELVIKEGWLQKEGGASKHKWQARWFKLQGKSLHYFTKREDSHSQGCIHLDEVLDVSKVGEHSGRPYCFSLVTTKAGTKKVYYLSAESEAGLQEWYSVLQDGSSPGGPSLKLVKYATAEVFLTQGIRISGDVHFNILATISQRLPPEKKKRDNFGWFCDCPIALATVLNLFAQYGWVPERVYRSTAMSGTDSSVQPVIRVIFSKSPPGTQKQTRSSLIAESPLTRSGNFDAVSVSAQPVASFIPPGATLLEGADDELIALMQEFDIPLSLLRVPSE